MRTLASWPSNDGICQYESAITRPCVKYASQRKSLRFCSRAVVTRFHASARNVGEHLVIGTAMPSVGL